METAPAKKKRLRLPKSKAARLGLLALAVLSVWLLLRIAIPLIWPLDNYLTVSAENTKTYTPYAHTYEPLDITDTAALSVLGYSPVPAYVPEGYALEEALLVTDEDAFESTDARAVRLEYVNGADRKKSFFVMAAAGGVLSVEAEKASLNDPSAHSNAGTTRWADFGGMDVIVYQLMGTRQYFAKFSPNGHEWLICFTNMSKREVRLVITAVVESFADTDH